MEIAQSHAKISESIANTEEVMTIAADFDQSGLMDIEAVQKVLNRSRASIYRYANTDPHSLNPPYNPQRLNAELRASKDEVLLFHPTEVARFARDVLKIKQVTIEMREPVQTTTQELLQAILTELQTIHELLRTRP